MWRGHERRGCDSLGELAVPGLARKQAARMGSAHGHGLVCSPGPKGGGGRQMSWDLCPGLHWAGCADHGAQGCCHPWPSRELSGSLVWLLCTELGGSTVSVGQA